jgi:hypothetical protein
MADFRAGTFSVDPGRSIAGELSLGESETFVYLHDESFFFADPDQALKGKLRDLSRVTLLQCTKLEHGSLQNETTGEYYYEKLLPNYVLEGETHLDLHESINRIDIVLDDLPRLFHDHAALGLVTEPARALAAVAALRDGGESFPIGPSPWIAYFGGRQVIFEAPTVLGRVTVQHNPTWKPQSLGGIHISDHISVSLEPAKPVAFNGALDHILTLVRFFEVAVGRPQNLERSVLCVERAGTLRPLTLHWAIPRRRDEKAFGTRRVPHPIDMPLDPIGRPDEFLEVLQCWLTSDVSRRDARLGYQEASSRQSRYSVERLIIAANMFDLLPSSAVPTKVALSKELLDAKRTCKRIFRNLPTSEERTSLLQALGRLGTAVLKRKVRHRAAIVLERLDNLFPLLEQVLDKAVDCRNSYVHGPLDAETHRYTDLNMRFFTDSLEFVFAASDLVDAGWNIEEWAKRGTAMTHPFSAYRITYRSLLRRAGLGSEAS